MIDITAITTSNSIIVNPAQYLRSDRITSPSIHVWELRWFGLIVGPRIKNSRMLQKQGFADNCNSVRYRELLEWCLIESARFGLSSV